MVRSGKECSVRVRIMVSRIRGKTDKCGTSEFGAQKRSQAAESRQGVKQRGWETNRRKEQDLEEREEQAGETEERRHNPRGQRNLRLPK